MKTMTQKLALAVAVGVLAFSNTFAVCFNPSRLTVERVGGTYTVEISPSNIQELERYDEDYRIFTNQSWIRPLKGSTMISGRVSVEVAENDTVGTRTGYFSINGSSCQITQAGYDASVSPMGPWFDYNGGPVAVRISTNDNALWEVATNVAWITVSPTTGRGSGEVILTADEDWLGEYRSAYLEIAGQQVYVSQGGHLTGASDAISSTVTVPYAGIGDDAARFWIDDQLVFSSTNSGSFVWRPREFGQHKLSYSVGDITETRNVEVTQLTAEVEPAPNPPTEEDAAITIMPTLRTFGSGGGGAAIVTSGSGTWQASVSDPWIVLDSGSGAAGYPVAYVVAATTNAEQRTGYVYVSGHVHTIKQEGLGAEVTVDQTAFNESGGAGHVDVVAADLAWKAYSNADWIYVVDDMWRFGSARVTFRVAPLDEVDTRQGTLTVAGQTISVFQTGREIKISPLSATCDFQSHSLSFGVNALPGKAWEAISSEDWIDITGGVSGVGNGSVALSVAENRSYNARTATVSVGSETFTVTQTGCTELEFFINPESAAVSVAGTVGLITVSASPDLPWTATSSSNWLTIYEKFHNGAGDGNIAYSAMPNPTLADRTGAITIETAEKALGVRTHTVTQPAASSSISMTGYQFAASGESCSVDVTVGSVVEWDVTEALDWLTVDGDTSRVGPGRVVLRAAENDTVYPRSGTVTIAGKTFSVEQKPRGVTIEYDTRVFGEDGGYTSLRVYPDGEVSWTAIASDTMWITIFQNDSGAGEGEIRYIISPYVGGDTARVGTITVGDQVLYITQRTFAATIEPGNASVSGKGGAGEFSVSAEAGKAWSAIATEPWITLVDGYSAGTGSGTVRFVYTENTTGKTRTGKILVNGEVYTLQQQARTMVAITAEAGRGGSVSGGGSYDLGETVTLTAIPDSGYKFSYWTGDVESMENPLDVTADVAKSVSAVFEPLPIAFTSVESSEDGVALAWNGLAWAAVCHVYRSMTEDVDLAIEIATLANDGSCEYLDATGDAGQDYWYWVEAEGAEDHVMSAPATGKKLKPIVYSAITYENLRGATNTNPATYQEGTLVSFANPGGVTGYTFAGWSPAQITADMTGAQTVRASWTANSYAIVYDSNGGSGEMDATAAAYDSEATVAANGFTWAGHVFVGWATEEDGEVVYAAGQSVTNLTAESNGVVTFYAVWEIEVVAEPVITPGDGAVFKTETCTVTITCATLGATIYCSTNGRTPTANSRYLYTGPFTISDTTIVTAFAVKDGQESGYVDATITHVIPEPLTLKGVLDEEKLAVVTTGGEAEWSPVEDDTAQVGGSLAVSGVVADDDEEEHSTWLKAKVSGKGTLTFWWRVDCEPDPRGRFTYDHATVTADGVLADSKDGTTGWMNYSTTFETEGEHEIVWTYIADGYPAEDGDYAGRMWVDGVSWSGAAAGSVLPVVDHDDEVAAALAGSADVRLTANITTKSEYDNYRTWALSVSGGAEAVQASPHAYASYMLGTAALLENEPTFNIDAVAVDEEGSSTSITLSVTIKDDQDAVQAAQERVAALFEATESLRDWVNGRLTPTVVPLEGGEGGAMRFKVTPGDGTSPHAFLRLNLP